MEGGGGGLIIITVDTIQTANDNEVAPTMRNMAATMPVRAYNRKPGTGSARAAKGKVN